jgi:hypothetical protein
MAGSRPQTKESFMPFQEGQEVRVKTLLRPRHWERHTGKVERVPAVSDVGLVVDVDASSGKMIYTVECTDENGSERWLTDFVDDELELLPRA